MKIALISDIHGNLHALDRVLAAIHDEQVDQIVCLGDVAALGPHPAGVVARLRQIGCLAVMGNCDVWLAEWPLPEEESDLWRQACWAAELLSPQDLAFIRGFQPATSLRLDGGSSLLCFHGSPRSNREVILATTPDDQLAAMLAGHDAAILIGGHTHIQMVRRFGKSLIVNAGSVGLPYDLSTPPGHFWHPPWAEWAMIEETAGHMSIELRRTPLDVAALIEMAKSSTMPGVEAWIAEWQYANYLAE